MQSDSLGFVVLVVLCTMHLHPLLGGRWKSGCCSISTNGWVDVLDDWLQPQGQKPSFPRRAGRVGLDTKATYFDQLMKQLLRFQWISGQGECIVMTRSSKDTEEATADSSDFDTFLCLWQYPPLSIFATSKFSLTLVPGAFVCWTLGSCPSWSTVAATDVLVSMQLRLDAVVKNRCWVQVLPDWPAPSQTLEKSYPTYFQVDTVWQAFMHQKGLCWL